MTWHSSLGDSAFVDFARKELVSAFTKGLWDEVGGTGQVQAQFKSATEVGTRFLGEDAKFHLSVFINRPEKDSARFSLAVRLEPTRGMTPEESAALRDDVAADLRRVLLPSPLGQHPARQSTVAAIKVATNPGEADTARAAEAIGERVRKALQAFQAVEPALTTWCAERLPALLERDGQPAQ